MLARADPVPRILAYLAAHPDVTAALGGAGRVSSRNEPPYPHLRVTNSLIDPRTLRWLVSADVQLRVYGDLDGLPGMAELARICQVSLGVLGGLPQAPRAADEPVVSHALGVPGGGPMAEASGQPYYLATARVWAHPAA